MATTVTKTVKASGGDYTSLANWEAGEQGDLTGVRDEIAAVVCSAMHESSGVAIDGWTTSATQYIDITADAASYAGPVWDENKYHIDGAATGGIYPTESYLRIHGIQVRSRDTNISTVSYIDATGEWRIWDCYIQSTGQYAIQANKSLLVMKVWNTVLGGATGAWATSHSAGTAYYSNVTLISGNSGLVVIGATVVAKNFLVRLNSNYDFYCSPGSLVCTNCASGDGTADDFGGSGNRVNQTFTFAGAGDYHLASTDAGARTYGADLSADAYTPFSTDMDGESRGATWDIGADQYVAPVTARPSQLLNAAALSRASRW